MLPNQKKLIEESKKDIIRCAETVYLSCRTLSKNDLKKRYKIKDFKKKAEDYQIDISADKPFAVCSAFINNKDDYIDINAVCFALLILSKALQFDPEMKDNDKIRKTIDKLICTVIVAAQYTTKDSQNYVYWPKTIDNTNQVESGTCNQTTIALSALLRVGFLQKNRVAFLEKKDDLPDEVLDKRYELVVNALSWVIDIQRSNEDGSLAYWAYGEACTSVKDETITYSVLSSHFCYETLKKYFVFFNSELGSTERAFRANPSIIDSINTACAKFEKWVIKELKETKGVKKTNTSDTPSLLHTCLCQIIYFFDNQKLNTNTLQCTVEYEVRNINKSTFKGNDWLEVYKFKYETDDNGDDDDKQYRIRAKADLSAREIEIIQLCANGMSAQQIADRLGLSRRTVEVHKSHVFEKLDLNTTAELVKYAYDAGLVAKN